MLGMAKQIGGRPGASRLGWEFMEDLSASPVPNFVDSLKRAYVSGTGKAGSKFQTLSLELTKALEHSPSPGPCTFVAQCMEALVDVEDRYAQGLGHLVTRSLNDLDDSYKSSEDVVCSRKVAAKLFKEVLSRQLSFDERVLVRLITVFGVQISDVAEAYRDSNVEADVLEKQVTDMVESFILDLVKNRSYNVAVSLLRHFNLHDCTSQDFLVTMVSDGQPDLAGNWAEVLGKESCCFLVEQCTKMELYKVAYRLVERFNLYAEFPEAYHLYKRSSLRKLVSKGLWEIAESVASSDRVLQEYLISLALGRRQKSRAVELCNVFQLKDLDLTSVDFKLVEVEAAEEFMRLADVVDLEKVFWIDDSQGINLVMKHLYKSETVGFDTEWKPVRIKGEDVKVSIIQMAIKDSVFVLDLPKLSLEEPKRLNECMEAIFQSEEILKLGYALGNDLELLAESYPEINGFKVCNMLLDLQTFPTKALTGGLSALAKHTLGSPLDKVMRMSDWSRRPLSKAQLHYAALDAAVLLPIHEKLCSVHSIADMGRSCSISWDYMKPQPQPQPQDTNASRPECQVKNELQEFADAAGLSVPVYETTSSGPDHLKEFISTVTVGGKTFRGSPASRKKESEYSAAQAALASLSNETASECLRRGSDGSKHSDTSGLSPQSNWALQKLAAASGLAFQKLGVITGLTPQTTQRKNDDADTQLKGSKRKAVATCPKSQEFCQLKNQLQELIVTAGLPLPRYDTMSWGPEDKEMFMTSVSVGRKVFHGNPCTKKIDSRISAAEVALASLSTEMAFHSENSEVPIENDTCPSPDSQEHWAKNQLQELVVASGLALPVYDTIALGPDHAKMFISSVAVGGKNFRGNAARRKKDSEFSAAQAALASLLKIDLSPTRD